ncbi:MAG: hypothetical protein M1816_006295 [Peltula sp. TS41687]|nr:MAG: hypothetical protein M1816_006295 [Peltula sp. TS41687]
MLGISSPLAYPLSSSPPPVARRRMVSRKEETARPKVVGGFILDDDDDADQGIEFLRFNEESLNERLDSQMPAITADVREQPVRPEAEDSHGSSFNLTSIFGNSARQTPPAIVLEEEQISLFGSKKKKRYAVQTCSGKTFQIRPQTAMVRKTLEEMAAARTSTRPGRAKKGYYGIEIHKLLEESAQMSREPDSHATMDQVSLHATIETAAYPEQRRTQEKRNLLWTEKYRARRYIDLVGDERTHRAVLGWLKRWDPIVYPGSARPKPINKFSSVTTGPPQHHRKLLLLAGPPGHGKTTLAHVCARQAGYEILEINASDERSRDVVNGRIRDSVGTENVKAGTVQKINGRITKGGRPICVVVDEVDGVVSGAAGGGEGGFMKALIDLVHLDQKNSSSSGPSAAHSTASKGRRRPKNRDSFRLLRPIILVCNDAYHPALRSLRQSSLAEIIHIRKPILSQVVPRIQTIFEREGFPCDMDAVRKLCEAVWGTTSRREGTSYSGNVEGDLRGILVVAEWVAGKLRASSPTPNSRLRLTRGWVEQNVMGGLSHGGGEARGVGRGGARETVERVFLDGAGFPHTLEPNNIGPGESIGQVGVAEMRKRKAIQRLRELVESCGEVDRVVTDCFSIYPSYPYRDDSVLTKPNQAYEWLHFHDTISSKIFTGQEWELSPYLSQPVLAFHHLFSIPSHTAQAWTSSTTNNPSADDFDDQDHQSDPLPFTGPKADFSARETEKHNRAILSSLLSSFSIPLSRAFKSPEHIATELLPYLVRLVTPDVKPVIVGGAGGTTGDQQQQRGIASVRKASEKELVRRAVNIMTEVGIKYERGRLETDALGRPGGWVYRMEPPLDTLATYDTYTTTTTTNNHLLSTTAGPSAPTRYAVRQVLDQEYQKALIRRANEERQARYFAGVGGGGDSYLPADKENPAVSKNSEGGKGAGGTTTTRAKAKKRDFFGRLIVNEARPTDDDEEVDGVNENGEKKRRRKENGVENGRGRDAWISFHEGVSNAVRRPITLDELMRAL